MIRPDRVWPVAIILSAALVGALAVGGAGPPLRPIATLGFLAVCPGMAIIRLLQLEDVLTELTLAVAFSIALDALVAGTMLYVGWWSPGWALGLLLGVSVIGAACQLRPARLGSSTEETHLGHGDTLGPCPDDSTTDDATTDDATTDDATTDGATTDDATTDDGNVKVTICHVTGSASNPFVTIEVNENAVAGSSDAGRMREPPDRPLAGETR